jgi:hypothetical protein
VSTLVMIAAVAAEHAARGAGGSLENRLRAAMVATKDSWVTTDESVRFGAALEGCARTCDAGELERIEAEIRRLQTIDALLAGVPVDMERVEQARADAPEPVGTIKLWREVHDA